MFKAETVSDHADHLGATVGDHVQRINVIAALQAEGADEDQFAIVEGVEVKAAKLALAEACKKADPPAETGLPDGLCGQCRNANCANDNIGTKPPCHGKNSRTQVAVGRVNYGIGTRLKCRQATGGVWLAYDDPRCPTQPGRLYVQRADRP